MTSLLTTDQNTLIVTSKSTLFELSNKNKIENSLFGSVDKIVWIKNLKCYKTNITENNRENIVKLMVDMSKSPKLLYVKGMNLVSKLFKHTSEFWDDCALWWFCCLQSESEGDDDDQWDDKKLNDAYDKAVRIANVEVAKRVAMSTNTQGSSNDRELF